MIRFNTLKMEGFQSQVEYKVFKLDQPGLNIITGPNGIGKSTIFNGLSWVLYGKPLKVGATIDTWEHKRPSDYQGTMVTLSIIKAGYKFKITRCKGYKKQIRGVAGRDRLVFERDGEIYPKGIKDKRDIQTAITAMLGMSYELFINTVVFPQRVTRFIEEKGAAKKKLLEESFNLSWLTKMADRAKEIRGDVDQTIQYRQKLLKNVTDSIADYDEMLETLEKGKEDFELAQTEAIVKAEEQITKLKVVAEKDQFESDTLKQTIKDFEKDIAEWEADVDHISLEFNQKEHNRIQGLVDSAKVSLDHAKKHLESLRKGSVCSECGQSVGDKDANKLKRKYRDTITTKEEYIKPYEKDLEELQQKIDKGSTRRGQLEDARKDLKVKRTEWDTQEEERLEIEGAKGRIIELELKIKEEKAKEYKDVSVPIKRKKFLAFKEQRKEEAKLKKYVRKRKMYHWAITGPLSPTGIKSFLFNNLLIQLNNRIGYYERFTGFGVQLEINMDSARKDIDTIITKEGYPVSYADLSGGESQLVNVVMALAQADILIQENPSNLYIMDEAFEGLSPENVDIVGSLLTDRAKAHSLFVITHNNSFLPTGANIIRMELKD